MSHDSLKDLDITLSPKNKPEVLPCPFCGSYPDLPTGDGTQYEIECDDCGMASSSVQISDLMTIEERISVDFTDYRYPEEYINRARAESVSAWNRRISYPTQLTEQEKQP